MAPSNNRNQNTNQPPSNNSQPPPSNSQPPPNHDQPPPTGSQNPTIDINSPNHPLYLHVNDHPGLILISKKLIGSENYSSWKRSMMIALNAKNKLKIVTGEIIEPANELFEHYAQLDGHRIYQLVNDIVALKQHNYSIEVYYHKLKGLWDEHDALKAPYLCNCACTCENGKNNGDREQRKRLIQFLMRQNEKQREGRKSTFKPGVYCTNCSKEGHIADECYKLKGYLIGHPIYGKYKPPVTRSVNVNDNRNHKVNLIHGHDTTSTSTQAEASTSGNDVVFVKMDQLQNQLNQVMLMMQQCQKDPPTGKVNSYTIRKHKFIGSVMSRFKTAWVTDSGATHYICIILSIMHDTFICNPPIHVTLPNGQTLEVKICGKGINKRIAHGNLCEGLYIIYPDQITPTSPTVLTTSSKDNTVLWHSRLGHPSSSTLQQINPYLFVYDYLKAVLADTLPIWGRQTVKASGS
ncbi:cysteine-rich receptor-like protein kinase 8 [Tanacetum coccineum]